MTVRLTRMGDVTECEAIYLAAREFMIKSGNRDQWRDSYPDASDVKEDIKNGKSYVLEDGGEIVAVFYMSEGPDPTYLHIENGAWLSDAPYGVIHRIAVKYQGRGLVGVCFDEAFRRFQNLRIDTHRDNLPMRRALAKHGFEYCGLIHIENGEERLAYQKI